VGVVQEPQGQGWGQVQGAARVWVLAQGQEQPADKERQTHSSSAIQTDVEYG